MKASECLKRADAAIWRACHCVRQKDYAREFRRAAYWLDRAIASPDRTNRDEEMASSMELTVKMLWDARKKLASDKRTKEQGHE